MKERGAPYLAHCTFVKDLGIATTVRLTSDIIVTVFAIQMMLFPSFHLNVLRLRPLDQTLSA